MITTEKRKKMLDYIVSKLEPNYSKVEPMTRRLSHTIETTYVKVNDGILLLVDKGFLVKDDNTKYNTLYNTLHDIYNKACAYSQLNYSKNNVGFIIYKDGKKFFRAAAPRHQFKANKNLSLKNYKDKMHNLIFFTPEEKFIYNLSKKSQNSGILNYYQPESEKLKEGIILYEFQPVIFDYSQINSNVKFKPKNGPSQKDHLWINNNFINENIKLQNGNIIQK